MTENRMNDNVISFDGRGAAGAVRNAVAEQQRREMRGRIDDPGAYVYSDIMAADRENVYRSGSFKGEAYMTVKDFARLFEDESNRRLDPRASALAMIEKENADRRIKTEPRPAHAYCVSEARPVGIQVDRKNDFDGKKDVVYAGDRRVEMKVGTMPGSLRERVGSLVGKWCGNEFSVTSARSFRRSSATVAAIGICIVFALVLALPISLSVMISNESGHIAEMESTVRSKEAEIEALEVELDQKNNRFLLEDLAVNRFGMVDLDSTNYSVLTVNASDAIEVFGSEKENGGAVLALLSALGLRNSDK